MALNCNLILNMEIIYNNIQFAYFTIDEKENVFSRTLKFMINNYFFANQCGYAIKLINDRYNESKN